MGCMMEILLSDSNTLSILSYLDPLPDHNHGKLVKKKVVNPNSRAATIPEIVIV